MTRYLISFGAHAMDHIPDEDMPAVAKASIEVVQEAQDAGVWVYGAGLESQRASIVATDGMVTDGPFPETKEVVGGFSVVDVPSREEALAWAAKIAVVCRCAQEVRELLPDPRGLSKMSLARSAHQPDLPAMNAAQIRFSGRAPREWGPPWLLGLPTKARCVGSLQ